MFERVPRSLAWSLGGTLISSLVPLGLLVVHAALGPAIDRERGAASAAGEPHTDVCVTRTAADSALDEAKRGGRDRIATA